MTTKQKKPAKPKLEMDRPKAKVGRPSIFTSDLAAAICDRLAEGESMRRICLDDHMPGQRTIYAWLESNLMFQQQYTRAREMQADKLADEIIEIADDSRNDTYIDGEGVRRTDQEVIARARLRVDARKWYAGKLAPKKYGDKLQQDITITDNTPMADRMKLARERAKSNM